MFIFVFTFLLAHVSWTVQCDGASTTDTCYILVELLLLLPKASKWRTCCMSYSCGGHLSKPTFSKKPSSSSSPAGTVLEILQTVTEARGVHCGKLNSSTASGYNVHCCGGSQFLPFPFPLGAGHSRPKCFCSPQSLQVLFLPLPFSLPLPLPSDVVSSVSSCTFPFFCRFASLTAHNHPCYESSH